MSEGHEDMGFVRYSECKLISNRIEDKIEINTAANEKILRILQGNGEGGVLWKVNSLMLRNVWIDKGVNIVIGIGASLITLYITGALHL